ncbi:MULTISPECIES: hypothetical protein [Parafrankia]|uniref:hypothetical protein n=1 Tax=Parafrankia TaxID=2994362 RepID=UPI001041E13C|nr:MULTISPECIES: hypothetical protein [Parafrankia]MBE3202503.1 hypothetical protein [Parafrankia sp. CH37]
MSRRPAPAANGAAVTVSRGLLDDVTSGVSDLAAGARDRALSGLTSYAHRMPGYKLLGVVLGRDVLTGTEVPRSAATVVGGFLELVPRGQEIFENLNRSGALERASAWFEAEVPKLGLSWEAIRALFSRAWDALDITDLADPAGAWAKIAGVFGPPLQALLGFARSAAGKVMEFVFEGALALAGGAGEQVMAIIRRAGDVLGTIVNDPVRFAGNLAAAVRTGLGQFVGNIGTHLQSGLLGWLTGALRGAVRIPARLDLNGIVSVVLDLLGLSWSALRTRLVRLLGERVVRAMETAVDWVQRIITGGLGAVVDKIMESATGLLDTVLGGIRDWVARSVVGAAVTRLISMFNPAGAVIQAIIAAYNTVQFFIERAQQLAAFATSVFDSIAKIAAGSIGDAANAVEQALARSVPVVLGFLARLLGLGDIAAPVRDVVGRVRGVVDGALDRVADWLASVGRRLVGGRREGGERHTAAATGADGAATPGAAPASATAPGTAAATPAGEGTAEGSVIATASTTAAGHAYTGRAVVAGGRVEVQVQRAVVKAGPAAAASAAAAPNGEARSALAALSRMIQNIEERRLDGLTVDSRGRAMQIKPEEIVRIQALLRQVVGEDLVKAAALYVAGVTATGSSRPALSRHQEDFAKTPRKERRAVYYTGLVPWDSHIRGAIAARDYSRIELQVRSLGADWIAGEGGYLGDGGLRDLLRTGIRIGSRGGDNEPRGEYPKFIPHASFMLFEAAAGKVVKAEREARKPNPPERRAALQILLADMRQGERFDVDHIRPLALDWEERGHRSTAEERARVAADPSNLELVSLNWNRSKGGEDERFLTEPAAGFTRAPGEASLPVPPEPAAEGLIAAP